MAVAALSSSYAHWRNGTLVVVNKAELEKLGKVTYEFYKEYISTVAEVVVTEYGIHNLWWPKFNKFETWSTQFILKLKP